MLKKFAIALLGLNAIGLAAPAPSSCPVNLGANGLMSEMRKTVDLLQAEGLVTLTESANGNDVSFTSPTGFKLRVRLLNAADGLYHVEMQFPGDLPPADGADGGSGQGGDGKSSGDKPADQPKPGLGRCLFNGQVLFWASNTANLAGAFKKNWDKYLPGKRPGWYTRWIGVTTPENYRKAWNSDGKFRHNIAWNAATMAGISVLQCVKNKALGTVLTLGWSALTSAGGHLVLEGKVTARDLATDMLFTTFATYPRALVWNLVDARYYAKHALVRGFAEKTGTYLFDQWLGGFLFAGWQEGTDTVWPVNVDHGLLKTSDLPPVLRTRIEFLSQSLGVEGSGHP